MHQSGSEGEELLGRYHPAGGAIEMGAEAKAVETEAIFKKAKKGCRGGCVVSGAATGRGGRQERASDRASERPHRPLLEIPVCVASRLELMSCSLLRTPVFNVLTHK